MEFNHDVALGDIARFGLVTHPDIHWRWVTIDENDMRNKIHIYINHQPDGVPVGWQRITSDTCLGRFAKLVLERSFSFNDPILEGDFACIKRIHDNFELEKFLNPIQPFRFIGHSENGPFMIWDGVHRLTATFILQILETVQVTQMPITHAVCGISQSLEGDLGRIPLTECG